MQEISECEAHIHDIETRGVDGLRMVKLNLKIFVRMASNLSCAENQVLCRDTMREISFFKLDMHLTVGIIVFLRNLPVKRTFEYTCHAPLPVYGIQVRLTDTSNIFGLNILKVLVEYQYTSHNNTQ